jgi:acetyl esterase/lipase
MWISPAPHLIRGNVEDWAQSQGVSCARIPGYWFEKKGLNIPVDTPPRPGEKIIYSFHGGAFTKHSAHPDDIISNLRHGVLEHTRTIERLFNLEFRTAHKSSGASVNPFPAQLIDAIAGYSYLVNDIGFAPEDIVLLGDSAGGNLALMLVRYLLERRAAGDTGMPGVPSAVVLCSPWTDVAKRAYRPESSAIRNRDADYMDLASPDFGWTTGTFLGRMGETGALTNRYLSPSSESPSLGTVSFEGFPRTLIVSGGAEVLQDQIHVLRRKMVADMGEDAVDLVEFPDAIHDFFVFPWHEPERTQALRIIAAWIESQIPTVLA